MTVARDLLGCVVELDGCAGRIVEVEAYLGKDDLAAHSARGITDRTRVIFGPPGHAYIYLIYGMYECLNLVAEPEGSAGCVLIRALEPLEGVERMRTRRASAGNDISLMNGPGKLTIAMGISRREHLGCDVTRGPLRVTRAARPEQIEIGISPRIGIRECADLPLRFFILGNPFVSPHRFPKKR